MRVLIESKGINGDRYDNDTLLIIRDSSSVELTIYADVYNWQGCGDMPPTALNPKNGVFKLPPPFTPGYFIFKLHQPEGTTTLDTVIVKP